MKDKSFEIKVKPSGLSEEEKRRLLTEVFDILFGQIKNKKSKINQTNKNGVNHKS